MAKTSRQKELRELLDRCDKMEVQIATDKARIQAQLAEAEKPTLRHGDIRMWSGCGGIVDKSEPAMHIIWADDDARSAILTEEDVLQNSKPVGTLGEYFRDLRAMSEDLTVFEMACLCNSEDTLQVAICGGCPNGNDIHFSINRDGRSIHVPLKDIPAFILNLQRLVHTAGKEKN